MPNAVFPSSVRLRPAGDPSIVTEDRTSTIEEMVPTLPCKRAPATLGVEA
jgi:hypothetical protein